MTAGAQPPRVYGTQSAGQFHEGAAFGEPHATSATTNPDASNTEQRTPREYSRVRRAMGSWAGVPNRGTNRLELEHGCGKLVQAAVGDSSTSERLVGKSGRVETLQADARVVAFRLTGHLEAEFAPFIFRAVDGVVGAGGRPKIHLDCFDATGFENAFDSAMRAGIGARRKALEGFVVGTKNLFISMAISVANVLLRGFIRVAKTRDDFDRSRANG
jgi:hypothetical protein